MLKRGTAIHHICNQRPKESTLQTYFMIAAHTKRENHHTNYCL